MSIWQWLIVGLLGLAIVPALWLLDRLGLWLEQRGWLYYRKKKPSSSPMSAWVALQQAIEPSVRQVVQIGEERKSEQERKQKLLANLLAALDAQLVNLDEIRLYLTQAKQAGLDWKALYQEAVRVQQTMDPERASRIPSAQDVAPLD
jgi:hypothetical protein